MGKHRDDCAGEAAVSGVGEDDCKIRQMRSDKAWGTWGPASPPPSMRRLSATTRPTAATGSMSATTWTAPPPCCRASTRTPGIGPCVTPSGIATRISGTPCSLVRDVHQCPVHALDSYICNNWHRTRSARFKAMGVDYVSARAEAQGRLSQQQADNFFNQTSTAQAAAA